MSTLAKMQTYKIIFYNYFCHMCSVKSRARRNGMVGAIITTEICHGIYICNFLT